MDNKRQSFTCQAVLAVLLAFCTIPLRQAQTRPPENSQTQTPNKRGQEVDPDDVIRINTTIVNSPVLVIGRNGKFVPTLQRDDFVLLEDGIPQEIAHFSTVQKPFTVAILIDTSRSTSVSLEDVKDSAIAFVDNMRTNDQAMVISFSQQIRVLAEPTTDRETLRKAIRSCRPEGSSRVYDAVSFALTERLDRITGRTAVVMFSDGVDNDSVNATFEGTLKLIKNTQALIFPVQFNTYEFAQRPLSRARRSAPVGSGLSREDYLRADVYLHQAAVLSGTGVYPAQDINDLNKAVASISDELHNEYNIGYYPRNPGQLVGEHKIEVRTKAPNLLVRARTSYSLNPSGAVARLLSNTGLSESSSNLVGSIPVARDDTHLTTDVSSRWMCKGPNTPTNLAVVREAFISKCPKSSRPNDESNAWFVKVPGKMESICKGFMMWRGREVAGAPIPTGYVVSRETVSSLCAKSGDRTNLNNAWVIQPPTTTNTVCKDTPIPRGYVTVREKSVPDCPPMKRRMNAWTIRPKQ